MKISETMQPPFQNISHNGFHRAPVCIPMTSEQANNRNTSDIHNRYFGPDLLATVAG